MYCTSALTAEFANNYPQAMLRPRAGLTTIITNANGLSLRGIIRTLQWADEVPIADLENVFVKRSFAYDDKGTVLPTRTANGSIIEGRTSTVVMEWFPNKTPGHFSEKTLKSLTELSRGGTSLGTHEAVHDIEPSVVQMRQLNSVINMNLKAKGTPQQFLSEMPKKKVEPRDSLQESRETDPSSLGLLKLRPWNRDRVAPETPALGSVGRVLKAMEVESSSDIKKATQEHFELVRETPSSKFRPRGPPPEYSMTPSSSLIDRMVTFDRTPQAPGRSAFALDSGGGGQLIRGSASTTDQSLVVNIQSMLARAEAQRVADLRALREEMHIMQNNANVQITATVTASINAAFDTDAFATRMAMAAQAVLLASQKASLSAEYAPASVQGNPSPQSGVNR
jgi:hypothetical protein